MAKILIVEDDQFLLKMYQKKFEVSGFEVMTASDGEKALEVLKSASPDLILMDVMMPKMNGLEVLDTIKKDEKTRGIPVLIFTNLSATNDSAEAIKKGAEGYIVKSDNTPAQVVEKVKSLLNKKTAAATS